MKTLPRFQKSTAAGFRPTATRVCGSIYKKEREYLPFFINTRARHGRVYLYKGVKMAETHVGVSGKPAAPCFRKCVISEETTCQQ